MATKKAKKSDEAAAGAASNGVSIYDLAVDEIKSVGASDTVLRKIEGSPLKEGRGDDVVRLHTTLKAIDAAHQHLAQDVASLHEEANASFEKTWNAMSESFDKTWKTSGDNFKKTWEASDESFDKTWKTIDARFDKTWESLGQNFEATNERTKREIHDLREELTKVLDKRFTQIDQTFASIRADIEVLKALQMELIKERIGRPEIMKR